MTIRNRGDWDEIVLFEGGFIPTGITYGPTIDVSAYANIVRYHHDTPNSYVMQWIEFSLDGSTWFESPYSYGKSIDTKTGDPMPVTTPYIRLCAENTYFGGDAQWCPGSILAATRSLTNFNRDVEVYRAEHTLSATKIPFSTDPMNGLAFLDMEELFVDNGYKSLFVAVLATPGSDSATVQLHTRMDLVTLPPNNTSELFHPADRRIADRTLFYSDDPESELRSRVFGVPMIGSNLRIALRLGGRAEDALQATANVLVMATSATTGTFRENTSPPTTIGPDGEIDDFWDAYYSLGHTARIGSNGQVYHALL